MKSNIIHIKLCLLLLCGMCHAEAYAYGYDKNAPSQSWGYQPVVNTCASMPTYEFYTTSLYVNSISDSKAKSFILRNNEPRRISSFDEEDDPIGVVPDLPVGDTPWCLLFFLSALFLLRRRRSPLTPNR